jgi:hypothetical protein
MQEDGATELLAAEASLQETRATPAKAKGQKKTAKDWDPVLFRREAQSAFHLPLTDAARALGLCVTELKKRCREIQVPRWPYRKIASIEKLIESVDKVPSKFPHMLAPPQT